ncbi:MAG: long-chain fatty acid--CoA ligase [Pseudonocardiales bacterium]|nr:MAG: long-chain fatty acid--CoA ligase [Pseudonocardiales bacterium]
MRSTMQDVPLSIGSVLRYASTAYGTSTVSTWTGEGSRKITYADVGRRCAQLANALRRLGITGDQRVATFQWNNTEHLEVYLAAPAMGAVLHTLNIRLFPEQLIYVANHGEDQVVVVDNTLVPLLARVLPKLETVRHVLVVGPADLSPLEGAGKELHSYDDLLAAEPDVFDWPSIDERQAAAMCYTSGTTGNPKGVVYSHRSAVLHSMSVCMGDLLGLSDRDRVLPVVPMFHANAWGLPYAAVMVGASLTMPDRFLQAEPLARLIETEKPTVAGAVPTIWNDLLDYSRKAGSDLTSLRVVACGGAAVPQALMEGFEQDLGVTIMQAWGMTETSPVASVARAPHDVAPDDEMRYRITQGRLLGGVEGRLVGPGDSFLPHDGKAVGELEVRGPWVTGSYYSGDDGTVVDADRFHDGWLRTGDVGSLTPDLFFAISDRSKDVIKSGGEWISSVELENQLMGHPAVLEASVVGVPDDKWGERPLACVVLRKGESGGPEEFREFLADRIAWWQVPERWAFIDAVPRTSVGKFDKKVLRQRYADGDLDVMSVS